MRGWLRDEATESSYFTITISGKMPSGSRTHEGEYTLHCVPIKFLRQMFSSAQRHTEFVIASFQRTLETQEVVTDYEFRTQHSELSFKAENRRQDCLEATSTTVARRPPVPMVLQDSMAGASQGTGTSSPTIGQAVNQLRSGDLAERLVARDALTQALTSQNAFSTAAAAWHVRNSNYDDDLGLLSAWLGQLRRTGDAGKEAAASLLIALNGEQASYLVALFTHPDRSLRLAAKETTGWLLQGRTHSRSLPLEKLLDPLRSLLSGSMHTSFVRQKTNNSPPPLRNYVVYDVVDALHKPWCS